jgi:DNA invertase Pin-like site-specific DNA recombinase
MTTDKIQATHLARQAFVYLRQSTPAQVETHKESTKRQYALAQRAKELGWEKHQVHILDADLGKSGLTSEGRSDFRRLIGAVGLGEVGAVFALDASRLSRSQADWHKLLELCVLAKTLVIDLDGIYDPLDFNDRLLLGLKGTWSHSELHAIKLRMDGAKNERAKRGELKLMAATGYVWNDDGKLSFDPDEGVVSSIRLVFRKFRQLGSAYKVSCYLSARNITLPARRPVKGEKGMHLEWNHVHTNRILSIIHNPVYAGAYVYGRRQRQLVVDAGELLRRKFEWREVKDWKVCLRDHHPAFISWDDYMENLAMLSGNRTSGEHDGRRGTPRRGLALLQGLIICGCCGRRMDVHYAKHSRRTAAYYTCCRQYAEGQRNSCCHFRSTSIDEGVERHVLAEVTRNNLDLSLAVLKDVEEGVEERGRLWRQKLERARYEARRAERQYQAVEPENRLVARSLERHWNEKLAFLAETERAFQEAEHRERLVLTTEQKQQILRLAKDLPTLWRAPATTQQDRKELLSLLLRQVALSPIDVPSRQTKISMLWHTGATTEIIMARPTGTERITTPRAIIEQIEKLAATHSDSEIARELNRRGLRGVHGNPFSKQSVYWLRRNHGSQEAGRIDGRSRSAKSSQK